MKRRHNPVNAGIEEGEITEGRIGISPRTKDHRSTWVPAFGAGAARNGRVADGRGRLRNQRLSARHVEAERAQEAIAHHGCRPVVLGRIRADVDAAARDHVVAAGELAAQHLL